MDELAKYRIELFKKAIYCLCLVRTLIILPISNYFWGDESFFLDDISLTWESLINGHLLQSYWWILVPLQITFITLGLLNKWAPITPLGIWFTTCNLVYPTSLANTSGDYLICIFLFFLLFTNSSNKATQKFGYWVLRGQVVLLYLVSGLYKLLDADWQSGTALLKTFQVDFFSLPVIQTNLTRLEFPLMGMTYLIILYQLSFVIFINIESVKKYFLAFGVIMHFGIAIFIGVFEFGILMIVSYALFYDAKQLLNRRRY